MGYLRDYPLDASATADILAGRATSAADLDDSQVATTFAAAVSFYVGMDTGKPWSGPYGTAFEPSTCPMPAR